jgi:hypothetical protein
MPHSAWGSQCVSQGAWLLATNSGTLLLQPSEASPGDLASRAAMMCACTTAADRPLLRLLKGLHRTLGCLPLLVRPSKAPPRDTLLESSSDVLRCISGDTELSEPAEELAELDCESSPSSSFHPVSAGMTLLLSACVPCTCHRCFVTARLVASGRQVWP